MLDEKYIVFIREAVRGHFPKSTVKAFLFGSAVSKNRKKFFDIDLGLMGPLTPVSLNALKEELEESTLPYKVDLVDFNKVDDSFRNNVFSGELIWL